MTVLQPWRPTGDITAPEEVKKRQVWTQEPGPRWGDPEESFLSLLPGCLQTDDSSAWGHYLPPGVIQWAGGFWSHLFLWTLYVWLFRCISWALELTKGCTVTVPRSVRRRNFSQLLTSVSSSLGEFLLVLSLFSYHFLFHGFCILRYFLGLPDVSPLFFTVTVCLIHSTWSLLTFLTHWSLRVSSLPVCSQCVLWFCLFWLFLLTLACLHILLVCVSWYLINIFIWTCSACGACI